METGFRVRAGSIVDLGFVSTTPLIPEFTSRPFFVFFSYFQVYDYLDFVKEPMDFDTMLSKLDSNEYNTASDFLKDIDLIAENAIAYNSDLNYETNKILCHRARALQVRGDGTRNIREKVRYIRYFFHHKFKQ